MGSDASPISRESCSGLSWQQTWTAGSNSSTTPAGSLPCACNPRTLRWRQEDQKIKGIPSYNKGYAILGSRKFCPGTLMSRGLIARGHKPLFCLFSLHSLACLQPYHTGTSTGVMPADLPFPSLRTGSLGLNIFFNKLLLILIFYHRQQKSNYWNLTGMKSDLRL